ncbi:MAG: PaaI family thioesterase [Acidimicrobiales bacterium]|nr:PaaI family thioesterase [Acidimicrobiales bacterium]
MTTTDLHRYMAEAWPAKEAFYAPDRFDVLRPGFCRYRYTVGNEDFRPGGTVSGPTMMWLADVGTYALLLAHLGDAALAVTTSLSIDFLRRPVGPQMVADTELVKLGRNLAVCRVKIASASVDEAPNMDKPEAVSSVTYSLSLLSAHT